MKRNILLGLLLVSLGVGVAILGVKDIIPSFFVVGGFVIFWIGFILLFTIKPAPAKAGPGDGTH